MRRKSEIVSINLTGDGGTLKVLNGPSKGTVINFTQPGLAAEGIDVGTIIRAFIIEEGTPTARATSLVRPQRGTIASINLLGDGGTLQDNNGGMLTFSQTDLKALGIVEGADVKFRIINLNNSVLAVSLMVVSD